MKLTITAEKREMEGYIAQVLKDLQNGCHSGYWSSERHWEVIK